MLVDHLYGLGHRKIILVSPPRHVFERGGAYAWRFRDAASSARPATASTSTPYYGESQQPGISRSLNAILDARADATALIVHNDASIAVLPAVLHQRGVRVPDDLSVVSLYSQDFGRSFLLPYTAVETSPDKLGREAVQHLVRRIIDPGYGADGREVHRTGTDDPGEHGLNAATPPRSQRRPTVEPVRNPCSTAQRNSERNHRDPHFTHRQGGRCTRPGRGPRRHARRLLLRRPSNGGSKGGGTYTLWDPYPDRDASSDWAKAIDACATDIGITIKRNAGNTGDTVKDLTTAAPNLPDIAHGRQPQGLDACGRRPADHDQGERLRRLRHLKPTSSAPGQIDGKTYGVPVGANTLGLYYNPTVLAAAGVDIASRDRLGDADRRAQEGRRRGQEGHHLLGRRAPKRASSSSSRGSGARAPT